MAEGEFDEFTNLSQLLTAATNVVIADIVEIGFFVFTLDRITL